MKIADEVILSWLAAFRCNLEYEAEGWFWPKPIRDELVRRGWLIVEADPIDPEIGTSEMTELGEAQVQMFAPEMGIAPCAELAT